jgi:hypothetical protein
MADEHTARMFRWRKQVRNDREGLTRFDFEVAYEVAENVFRRSGWAEFYQAAAAANLGASVRGLQKSLHRIASRGHLEIEDNSKSGRPNRYRPIVWAADAKEVTAATPAAGYEPHSYPIYEPQFVAGTNDRSRRVRTAVRTKHLESSEHLTLMCMLGSSTNGTPPSPNIRPEAKRRGPTSER